MPSIPVWKGFGPSKFGPTINPENGKPYEYAKDGFEATQYNLSTDQFGTQLDPPAHWAPEYPAIDELPATYAVRPLVVISIVEQVAKNPGYHLQVSDIEQWEAKNGKHSRRLSGHGPFGLVKELAQSRIGDAHGLPGVSLDALKFLHLQRQYSLPRSRALDTDTTPKLRGRILADAQRLRTQAEGVANLDKIPDTGCLVAIGYPKFAGGLGGYARYIAICPADWKYGISVGECRRRRCPRATRFYTGTPSGECASASSRFGLYARVVPSSRFALSLRTAASGCALIGCP